MQDTARPLYMDALVLADQKKTYLQRLCADTGSWLEDLLGAINGRDW